MLNLDNLGFAYRQRLILHQIDLAIAPGEMAALLGANGAGKSTLLRLAAGLLRPQRGQVYLQGRPTASLKRAVVAKEVAFVSPQLEMPFDFTVREMVFLGRTPHLGAWGSERPCDWRQVELALATTGTAPWSDRSYRSLSSGEKQQVHLAMALAQEPQLLLLDEPIAHLDICHQLEALKLLRAQNARGLTVLAAIHDLNLAAMYFDRLILLHQGSVLADGPPPAVLTEENIQTAFQAGVTILRSGSELRLLLKR